MMRKFPSLIWSRSTEGCKMSLSTSSRQPSVPLDLSVVLWCRDLNRTSLSFVNHGSAWGSAAARMRYGLR